MTITNKKLATTSAATFAAAFSSLYAAPEVQADVVDLSFSQLTVDISASASIGINTAGGFFVGSFTFDNLSASAKGLNTLTYLAGLDQVLLNQDLSAGNFFPTGGATLDSQTGTQYIGFRDFGGNVGWFSVNLGDGEGPATFLAGEFGTLSTDVVTVGGTTAVPEPASGALAALALGSIGLRRKRKVA